MGKPLLLRRSVDRSYADLVLVIDVIEGVEDDIALAVGTHFVVTVPAFMWLWSGHDIFLNRACSLCHSPDRRTWMLFLQLLSCLLLAYGAGWSG